MEMEHQREVPLAERQTCRVVTGEGKGSAGLRMQDRDAWGNLVPAQAHRLLLSQKPPRTERLSTRSLRSQPPGDSLRSSGEGYSLRSNRRPSSKTVSCYPRTCHGECGIGEHSPRHVLPQTAEPTAHPATTRPASTGLCHAACGSGEHASRQALPQSAMPNHNRQPIVSPCSLRIAVIYADPHLS